MVLEQARDDPEIIERTAAWDIGKASLVCCVRLPAASGRRRVQEVMTYRAVSSRRPAPT